MNKLLGTATSNYLFWTITSFYLQARDKPAESSLPLQLAEKMSKRAIEEKKLTTYEGSSFLLLPFFFFFFSSLFVLLLDLFLEI